MITTIERLPVLSRPGFDCIRDNANCPACSAGHKGNHGVHGGQYWFGVAMEHKGKRVALVLDVLGIAYPPTVPRPLSEYVRQPRGACLTLHREGGAYECEFLGKCEPEVCTFLGAAELYRAHGLIVTDPEVDLSVQSEAFWSALERRLVDYVIGARDRA